MRAVVFFATFFMGEFFECIQQFFEMLGTSMLALQESLDKSGNLLPLHRSGFVHRKLVGRGYAIATSVLRNVHTGVGYPNDVFYRQTVHRETRHPEASG